MDEKHYDVETAKLLRKLRELEAEKPRVVYPFMTEIYKEITVDSAHLLPNHDAKCKYLHGHTYKVGVTLRARLEQDKTSTNEGMVADFKHLKEMLRVYVDSKFDHNYVNDVMYENVGKGLDKHYLRTTAEQMAWWIFIRLFEEYETVVGGFSGHSTRHIEVLQVDVWETPTSKATAKREYFDYAQYEREVIKDPVAIQLEKNEKKKAVKMSESNFKGCMPLPNFHTGHKILGVDIAKEDEDNQ